MYVRRNCIGSVYIIYLCPINVLIFFLTLFPLVCFILSVISHQNFSPHAQILAVAPNFNKDYFSEIYGAASAAN